jgi:hypothetical protein
LRSNEYRSSRRPASSNTITRSFAHKRLTSVDLPISSAFRPRRCRCFVAARRLHPLFIQVLLTNRHAAPMRGRRFAPACQSQR